MKKPSSMRWLARHQRDIHVKKAQTNGYRSRAWFKLEEIVKKFNLFSARGAIIDLGAAPGGWSQFLSMHAPEKTCLIACDILEMKPLERVHFIQGNFLNEDTQQKISLALDGAKISSIFSDMAANTTGLPCVDESNTLELLETAWTFAQTILSPGGQCVFKGFRSENFDKFFKVMKKNFQKAVCYKPEASRSESKEIYLVALKYSPNLKI